MLVGFGVGPEVASDDEGDGVGLTIVTSATRGDGVESHGVRLAGAGIDTRDDDADGLACDVGEAGGSDGDVSCFGERRAVGGSEQVGGNDLGGVGLFGREVIEGNFGDGGKVLEVHGVLVLGWESERWGSVEWCMIPYHGGYDN